MYIQYMCIYKCLAWYYTGIAIIYPSPPSLHTGMHSSTDTWPFPVPDVSSMQTLQIVLGTMLPIAVILVFVVVTVMICICMASQP